MLFIICSDVIFSTIIPAIDAGVAVRVNAACFRDGNEDEYHVEFYRINGQHVRACYNARTTMTTYQWVESGSEADRRLGMMM